MSLLKEELHRLVDALPEQETLAVKRFLEFVLSKPIPKTGIGWRPTWANYHPMNGGLKGCPTASQCVINQA